jgi:putative DNA methylase
MEPVLAPAAATTGRAAVVAEPSITSPLAALDVEAISAAVRRETRNREVHLPPVSVYRWWARRTESVFGAIVDASARADERLLVADPFAGGGIIPLAAVMRGHRVYAQDVNPWAACGLAAMLGLPAAASIRAAAERLEELVGGELTKAYATTGRNGRKQTLVHTFRVATAPCPKCKAKQRLYPHALVSLLSRKERGRPEAFLACPAGHLFRGDSSEAQLSCPTCERVVYPKAVYTPQRKATCWCCGAESSLDELSPATGLTWEVVLVERLGESGRVIDTPTAKEVKLAESSDWAPRREFGTIPKGQETQVLLRHGYSDWGDLYPRRQRAILELLLHRVPVASEGDERVTNALRFAIVGAGEMAGYLSRWDRFYLKSYEAMAGHRFNFTTFAVEPNVWGAGRHGRGTVSRRLAYFAKAAEWLTEKAEHLLAVAPPHRGGRSTGELSDDELALDVNVVQGSSERMLLPDESVDLVLTDPPYHDDVQYSELSLPLRAWAGLGTDDVDGEAVVNGATGHNTGHEVYRALLESIFSEARRVLRLDGHLIFSYANREPDAWVDVLAALDAAGFRPCGYTVVHSENETDYAKRGVRACTLDLVLDLVPMSAHALTQHRPTKLTSSDEERFLRIVGETLLELGELEDGWEAALTRMLAGSRFLAGRPARAAQL